MRNILIIGAGKSTSYIVKYLVNKSIKENLFITIGDIDIDNAKKLSTNSNKTKAIKFDILNEKISSDYISKSDIVVSMLPARYHMYVAKQCLIYKKSLLTASYINKIIFKKNKEKANQYNRRTSFKVIREDYIPVVPNKK